MVLRLLLHNNANALNFSYAEQNHAGTTAGEMLFCFGLTGLCF